MGYGQQSALFEESDSQGGSSLYVPLDTLRDAPQRVWAKPIVFKDVLKSKPGTRSLKINNKYYTRFETVGLGSIYANDDVKRELQTATTGKEHIFSGTVLNRRSSFYIIVTSALEPQANPNEPSTIIGKLINRSVNNELRNHKAQVALVQLLDTVQGDMLVYARQNDIPFKDLFNERSSHSDRAIDIIRSSIDPLNYATQMKPGEILAQLLHLSLQEHYNIEGNDEPLIDVSAAAIAAAMEPKKEIKPLAPILSQLEQNTETLSSTADLISKKIPEEDKDLDALISALSTKPSILEPEDNPLKMKDTETPEAPVVKVNDIIEVIESTPAPAAEKVEIIRQPDAQTGDANLLSDIEALLDEDLPAALQAETKPPAQPEAVKPAEPVDDSLVDELDALLREVKFEEVPEAAPAPKPAAPAVPVEETRFDSRVPMKSTSILATAPEKLGDQPIGRKAFSAPPEQSVVASKPAKKKKRGFLGFGKRKEADPPADKPIVLASNLSKAPAPPEPESKSASKEDFTFQFSPIRR
jgi:hypothetical protein